MTGVSVLRAALHFPAVHFFPSGLQQCDIPTLQFLLRAFWPVPWSHLFASKQSCMCNQDHWEHFAMDMQICCLAPGVVAKALGFHVKKMLYIFLKFSEASQTILQCKLFLWIHVCKGRWASQGLFQFWQKSAFLAGVGMLDAGCKFFQLRSVAVDVPCLNTSSSHRCVFQPMLAPTFLCASQSRQPITRGWMCWPIWGWCACLHSQLAFPSVVIFVDSTNLIWAYLVCLLRQGDWYRVLQRGWRCHVVRGYSCASFAFSCHSFMPIWVRKSRTVWMGSCSFTCMSICGLGSARSRGSTHRSYWRASGVGLHPLSLDQFPQVSELLCHFRDWLLAPPAGNENFPSVQEGNKLCRRMCYLCLGCANPDGIIVVYRPFVPSKFQCMRRTHTHADWLDIGGWIKRKIDMYVCKCVCCYEYALYT